MIAVSVWQHGVTKLQGQQVIKMQTFNLLIFILINQIFVLRCFVVVFFFLGAKAIAGNVS